MNTPGARPRTTLAQALKYLRMYPDAKLVVIGKERAEQLERMHPEIKGRILDVSNQPTGSRITIGFPFRM